MEQQLLIYSADREAERLKLNSMPAELLKHAVKAHPAIQHNARKMPLEYINHGHASRFFNTACNRIPGLAL